MPRLPRTVFAGIPHHITQRGNRRENVFFSDGDRAVYLEWLQLYCEQHAVQIQAYCLMTNHIHIVATPDTAEGLQKVFKPLHMRYAQRINRLKGWRRVIYGKAGSFLHRWMINIFGRLSVMLSATPCVQVWWRRLRIIFGQVRLHIVV